VSELHIERDGDQVRIEGEASVKEIRGDLTDLASETVTTPFKELTKAVKGYLS